MNQSPSTDNQPDHEKTAIREPGAETPRPRQYRIICLIHRTDGHLKGLGYTEDGNGVMYDGTWTIAQAREAIFQGHRLYIVSPSTGNEVDLEFVDGRIRTTPHQATEALQNLPDCSQR